MTPVALGSFPARDTPLRRCRNGCVDARRTQRARRRDAVRPRDSAFRRSARAARPDRGYRRRGTNTDEEHPVLQTFLRGAIALALLSAGAPAATAADLSGRWEGTAQVPGAPQSLVLDIASGSSGWRGSIILPGRGVKGAPLSALRVDAASLQAELASAFVLPAQPAPVLRLTAQADGSLAGDLRMAGASAAVHLQRTGAAQVDVPATGTALSAQLTGTWAGRYELGGVPREVTLKVANGPDGRGRGEIVVVGKRTTTLPVDRVVQGREFVSFESSAVNYRIEGRWATPDGSIQAQVVQGPFEAPIVLRRAPGAAS